MTTPGKSATSNGQQSDDVAETSAHHAVPTETAAESSPEERATEDETTRSHEGDESGMTGESTESAHGDGPRRTRTVLMTRALAALLAVGVLAGGGYGGWLLYQQRQLDTASRDALNAARSYAVVLTSIDTNAIDQNFTDVLNGSTGEFKDMYSKSSDQLRQLLVDNKAAANGTVIESAVQSVTPDRVVVLMFIDQSITNSAVPDPRIDRSRIKMTMEKVDGRWLASKVELP